METARFTRKDDRLEPGAAAGAPLDPEPLLGEWHNTDPDVRGIHRLVITPADGYLEIRVFGSGSPAELDWGMQRAALFAKSASSREGMAFSAIYDLGFMRVRLQANVKLGVLVVASFNEFNDESDRTPYFTREFFYRIWYRSTEDRPSRAMSESSSGA